MSPPPMADRLDKTKKISDIIISWVGVGSLVLGGLWTVSEYTTHVRETRIARSLDLIERFNRDLSGPRLNLAMQWENEGDRFNRMREELAGAGADEVSRIYYETVIDIFDEPSRLAEIKQMIFFFDELVICVQSGICDGSIVHGYLADYGRSFFNRHYPVICKLRARWNDLSIAAKLQNHFTETGDRDVCVPRTAAAP